MRLRVLSGSVLGSSLIRFGFEFGLILGSGGVGRVSISPEWGREEKKKEVIVIVIIEMNPGSADLSQPTKQEKEKQQGRNGKNTDHSLTLPPSLGSSPPPLTLLTSNQTRPTRTRSGPGDPSDRTREESVGTRQLGDGRRGGRSCSGAGGQAAGEGRSG